MAVGRFLRLVSPKVPFCYKGYFLICNRTGLSGGEFLDSVQSAIFGRIHGFPDMRVKKG